MAEKDTLFQEHSGEPEDFQFTPKVAEVFDDMLERSVPFYREIIDMSATLLGRFLLSGDRLYDLGCSTGSTLLELARRFDGLDLEMIGVDNSAAMIRKARLKAEVYSRQESLRFIEADILEFLPRRPGAVIMNYTLQFIRPPERLAFLRKIHRALRPGGLLLVSEKTINHNPLFNRAFIQFYLDFKRRQGYSEIEIARKREALENVLVPFSNEENTQLLREAGFSDVGQFFQWFNFSSYAAVKSDSDD